MKGKELYTKRTISSAFPELRPFIYREATTQFEELTKCCKLMVAELAKITFDVNDRFHLLNAKEASSQLLNQCQGKKIVCLILTMQEW